MPRGSALAPPVGGDDVRLESCPKFPRDASAVSRMTPTCSSEPGVAFWKRALLPAEPGLVPRNPSSGRHLAPRRGAGLYLLSSRRHDHALGIGSNVSRRTP